MRASGQLRFKPVRIKPKKEKYPLSLKPGWQKPKPKPWLIKRDDGREKLDLGQIEGWREYRRRVKLMLERQEGTCCLSRECPTCPGALRIEDAVFEHEYGRGMEGGKADDRIERPGSTGRMEAVNGASHYHCNRWKGSRSIHYNYPPGPGAPPRR